MFNLLQPPIARSAASEHDALFSMLLGGVLVCILQLLGLSAVCMLDELVFFYSLS